MEVACVDVAAGRAQVRAKHGIGIVEGIHKGNGVWAEGEEEGGDGLGREGGREGGKEGTVRRRNHAVITDRICGGRQAIRQVSHPPVLPSIPPSLPPSLPHLPRQQQLLRHGKATF